MKVKRYPSILRWFLVHDHILNRHRNTTRQSPKMVISTLIIRKAQSDINVRGGSLTYLASFVVPKDFLPLPGRHHTTGDRFCSLSIVFWYVSSPSRLGDYRRNPTMSMTISLASSVVHITAILLDSTAPRHPLPPQRDTLMRSFFENAMFDKFNRGLPTRNLSHVIHACVVRQISSPPTTTPQRASVRFRAGTGTMNPAGDNRSTVITNPFFF